MKKFLIFIAILAITIGAWHFLIRPALDRLPPINETTKTCLVTGASAGIGLEIAREMVKRGWKVIGIARRTQALTALAHELGDLFIPFACDVSDETQIHTVCEEIKKQELKPTLFFLNAGTGQSEKLFQPFLQSHKEMFNTNYFGAIAWIGQWINEVKTYGGGTFVATSSLAALFTGPQGGGYSASKAALNAAFRSLRLQYRNENIGFVTVMPGPVKTEMIKVNKPMPFTHSPKDEAAYIVEKVFARKKVIEPSWFYTPVFRLLNWLPDTIVLKVI